jgi:hypothetical protein
MAMLSIANARMSKLRNAEFFGISLKNLGRRRNLRTIKASKPVSPAESLEDRGNLQLRVKQADRQ